MSCPTAATKKGKDLEKRVRFDPTVSTGIKVDTLVNGLDLWMDLTIGAKVAIYTFYPAHTFPLNSSRTSTPSAHRGVKCAKY
jgi:hypothetical protein